MALLPRFDQVKEFTSLFPVQPERYVLGQRAVRGVVASGFASSLGVYGFAVFLAADLSAGAWCRRVLGACRVE